eukprot:365980-Chlamydomonas_euryale.AAC.2
MFEFEAETIPTSATTATAAPTAAPVACHLTGSRFNRICPSMADDEKGVAESAGEVAREQAVEDAPAVGWEVEELEEDIAAQTSAREGDNVPDDTNDLDVGAQLDAARAQIAELKAQLAARDAEIAALKARGPVGSTAEPTPDIQKLQVSNFEVVLGARAPPRADCRSTLPQTRATGVHAPLYMYIPRTCMLEGSADRLASLKKEQADADAARDSAWRQLKSVVAEISKLAGPETKTGAQAATT